jgi:hypothetical protein
LPIHLKQAAEKTADWDNKQQQLSDLTALKNTMPFANTRPCKARLASLQHCFHTA